MRVASSSGSVSIAVAGRTQPQSTFEVAAGRTVHLDLPAKLSTTHIALATKDTEILQGILRDRPKEVQQIVSAVAVGNFKEAQTIAENIGLTEDRFLQAGGGLWALVVVIAVGCALLLAHD